MTITRMGLSGLFAALVLSPAASLAQAAPPEPYNIGDIFIERNGDTVQITKCMGTGWQARCQVRVLEASGTAPIDPSGRWWSVDTLRGSARYWTENGGEPYAGPAVPLPAATARPARTAAAPPRPAPAMTDAAEEPPAAQAGSCPKTPYGGPVPGSRSASPALFRQKISDTITMAAYGPYWYGVRLSGFTVGSPQRNTVSVQPGIGATRVNNGAPPGATMYPISTTMSVCEGAPSGSSTWRTSQKKYYCFVSANNEWTCGATN